MALIWYAFQLLFLRGEVFTEDRLRVPLVSHISC